MTRRSCLGHSKLPSNTDNGRWRREPRRGAVRHPIHSPACLSLLTLRWPFSGNDPRNETGFTGNGFPALHPFSVCFSNLFETTEMFLGLAAVWVCFSCSGFIVVSNFPNALIRLAVSHSLEISYAVWACLCCSVIFGMADCFHLHVRVCETS